jgi:copper(I)-binding protein
VRRTLRIRPTAAVAGAVLGAVVLAGCGAGQVSQTSRQVSAVDGANVTVGQIAVRNAQFVFGEGTESAVAYPRGSSAPLELTIVNTGGTADELVSITSPIGNGEIIGKGEVPAGRTLVAEGLPVAEPAPSATATAPTSGAAAGSSATPSATPSATAGRPTPTGAVLPTDAPDTAGTVQLVLSGLRDDIRSGLTYEVVLNFRQAGPVRLAVPVAGSGAERKDEHAE